ncbi:MAG: RNA polymerase sigma factor [Ignavibacteriae bacterium]|nr:RNA polymerase sigma factor [Ignavibacteriota bacterium]
MNLDEKQFKSVYDEHSKLIYNLCLSYVLNSEDAQDITQEVFVKVYKNYHKFNPSEASIKTWIYRIAINQCLDFLKAGKAKKRFGFITSLFHPESNELIQEAANIDHPGIELEDKEALNNLMKIIYSLPENQKTAVILLKIEGKPHKEAADIMDCSIKALESLFQRAKINIQKKLKITEGF